MIVKKMIVPTIIDEIMIVGTIIIGTIIIWRTMFVGRCEELRRLEEAYETGTF